MTSDCTEANYIWSGRYGTQLENNCPWFKLKSTNNGTVFFYRICYPVTKNKLCDWRTVSFIFLEVLCQDKKVSLYSLPFLKFQRKTKLHQTEISSELYKNKNRNKKQMRQGYKIFKYQFFKLSYKFNMIWIKIPSYFLEQ